MSITPAAINFTSTYETIDLELKLLTPMFGGGVAAHEDGNPNIKLPDFITPIRGTAVRGALRHWWRATTGAWFPTIKEMALQEGALFGTIRETSKRDAERLELPVSKGENSIKTIPSQVSVSIDCARLGESLKGGGRSPNGFGESYGAFPLSGDRDYAHGKLYHAPTSFSLSVRFPKKFKDQVKLALSAFVHFGGVGGRTTRGFG